jgi:hypothetical protein
MLGPSILLIAVFGAFLLLIVLGRIVWDWNRRRLWVTPEMERVIAAVGYSLAVEPDKWETYHLLLRNKELNVDFCYSSFIPTINSIPIPKWEAKRLYQIRQDAVNAQKSKRQKKELAELSEKLTAHFIAEIRKEKK